MVELRPLNLDDIEAILAADHLFVAKPTREWATLFLSRSGHHLILAEEDGEAVGFVSGMEICHPDKGAEMLLYELGVEDEARGRGVGTELCEALIEQAKAEGCFGMWAPMSVENEAASATYDAAGAVAVAQPANIAFWEF